MNKRQAKRRASRLAADLIYQYLQREEKHPELTQDQSDKVDAAMRIIAQEMGRRAAWFGGTEAKP